MRDKFEGKFSKSRGAVLIAGLLAVILVAGLFMVAQSEESVSYAGAGEDTVNPGSDPVEVFNITDQGVNPASHEVELGDSVEFMNYRGSQVELSFDRSNQTVTVGPESSESLLINGITYFEVSAGDYSAQGRVNVQ